MKYNCMLNLVYNLKHIKMKKMFFFHVYGGGGFTRNPAESQGGASQERFGNHWLTWIASWVLELFLTSSTRRSTQNQTIPCLGFRQ